MKKHVCPSCGGTLGLPDRRERMFKCSFCGSVIEDQTVNPTTGADRNTTPSLTVITQHVEVSSLPTYSAPKGRGCLVVVGLVVALVAGVGVFASQAVKDGIDAVKDAVGAGSDDGLDGTSLMNGTLVLADDGTADVVVAVRDDDDSVVHYLDLDSDDPDRWHDVLGADATMFDAYVSTPDAVYVSVDTRLFGWDRASGTRKFAVESSDVIQSSICDGCLRMIGSTLVMLTADGTLTGYDPDDGQTKWSQQTTDVPRQVLDYGGGAAVLDDDEAGQSVVKVYDVTNGAMATSFPLRCSTQHEAGIYDHLLPLPDGGFFWEGTDIITSCAQRYAPGATSPMWESPLPDGGVAVDNAPEIFAVVGDHAAVAHDDTITWYSLADGTRSQTTRPDEDLVILAARDGRLYVSARSTRGTSSWTILALEPGSGQVAWTHQPGGEPIGPDTFSITRNGWTVEPVDGGLVLISFDEDAEALRLSVLAAADGRSSDAHTVDLSDRAFIVWPSILGTHDGDLVVGVGTSVLVIDPTTGEVETAVP